MAFELPPLPFAKNALEPVMKSETFDYHYDKHHKAYVTKLNQLLEGKPEASKTLVEVIKTSTGGVFNTFFWDSLKAGGGGAPPAGDVADLINGLGGWDKFRADFIAAGVGRFGSGWVWLVLDGGKGKIIDTPNAETPLTTGAVPLVTADVWEHAYYIDHRNNRLGFLETFCDKLLNWDFVAKNLAAAK